MDKKFIYAGLGGVALVGLFIYKRAQNSAMEQEAQSDASIGFPVSSMGNYGAGMGAGALSISPSSGASGGLTGELPSGLLSTAPSLFGTPNSGGGMFDYMLAMGELQSKTDIALSKMKLDSAALMQNQFYGGELNLAQNSSLTLLGQQLANGGSINLSSNKSGMSSLTINKNLSYAEQKEQEKAAQQKSFLQSLYKDIAKKDTPDAGGFAYWQDALDRGSSFSTVAENFKSAVFSSGVSKAVGTPSTVIQQSSNGSVSSKSVPNVNTQNMTQNQVAALSGFSGAKIPNYDAYKAPERPSFTEPMTYKSDAFVGAMPQRPEPKTGGIPKNLPIMP